MNFQIKMNFHSGNISSTKQTNLKSYKLIHSEKDKLLTKVNQKGINQQKKVNHKKKGSADTMGMVLFVSVSITIFLLTIHSMRCNNNNQSTTKDKKLESATGGKINVHGSHQNYLKERFLTIIKLDIDKTMEEKEAKLISNFQTLVTHETMGKGYLKESHWAIREACKMIDKNENNILFEDILGKKIDESNFIKDLEDNLYSISKDLSTEELQTVLQYALDSKSFFKELKKLCEEPSSKHFHLVKKLNEFHMRFSMMMEYETMQRLYSMHCNITEKSNGEFLKVYMALKDGRATKAAIDMLFDSSFLKGLPNDQSTVKKRFELAASYVHVYLKLLSNMRSGIHKKIRNSRIETTGINHRLVI